MPVPTTPTGHTNPCPPARLHPAWLGAILGFCLPVACWIAIAIALGPLLFPALATDDYPRLILSMQWARTPFLSPVDRYWLPLPYWIFGAWYATAGRWLGLYAHLPLSGALVGSIVAMLMAVCRMLNARECLRNPARLTSAAWLAFVLPFSIPILYFIATSGLAETVYLPSLALVMLAMTRFIERPTGGRGTLLLTAAVLLQLSRYEGWPLSFAAISLAQLMTWRKTSVSPRQWPGWALTWLALFIVPAVWMALNARTHGAALHFLTQADEGAKLDTALSTYGLGYRLKFLLRHGIGQGWLILALAAAALPELRKDRRVLALGLLAAAAWALYFEAAFANTIGVARSERFCLGPLLITLPLGVLGGLRLCRRLRAWPLTGALFLLAFFTAFMLNHGYRSSMRQPLVNRPTYQHLLDLRRQAQENGLVAVIENPATFVHPGANLFRFYLGMDTVTMLDWYDRESPVQGKFLYFPDQDDPHARADGRLLRKPYLMLTHLPPPGRDPSR